MDREYSVDDDRSQKWLPILFFAITGGVFVFFAYYITANAFSPDMHGRVMDTHLAEVQMIPSDFTTLTLTLDTQVQVDRKRFVYRGMEGQEIRIEVIVPELDPDRGYLYQVPIARAEKGFSLAGGYFKVVKARQKQIRILRLESRELC